MEEEEGFPQNSIPKKCSYPPHRIRCCEDTLGLTTRLSTHLPTRPHTLILPSSSSLGPIPRPRCIILVRHGRSKGNVDESVYTRVPDPRIEITDKGLRDAEECGAMSGALSSNPSSSFFFPPSSSFFYPPSTTINALSYFSPLILLSSPLSPSSSLSLAVPVPSILLHLLSPSS